MCIPFLFPIPLPGFSTAFGFAIIFLAARTFFPKHSNLPHFLGKREISAELIGTICEKGTKFLTRAERFVHPRFSIMYNKFFGTLSSLVIISSSLALAIPVPPVIPFTNFFPAVAILLLSIGELEEDGISSLLGHVMHLVAWGYFVALGIVIFVSFEKAFEYLKPFLP